MLKRISLIFAVSALVAAMLGIGTATAAPPRTAMGGGSGIVIDDLYQCTLTTIGYDSAGRLVGITAGHCGEAGATVVSEADPAAGVVGEFAVSNSDYDYAVIRFDPAKVAPVDTVGQVTIDSIGMPATRVVTIRLTAIGGVNWPIARFIVMMMPNQTGSQW